MKTMETELQRLDNELYTIYLRSLEIAELKWLPNIKPRKDSYNSYPHIKGVMRHIDRLLYDSDENHFSLSGAELYVLLSAILLHDIGKGINENSSDHAYYSRKIIKAHWASLGLLTEKVAQIVADICRFHDCSSQSEMDKLYTEYYMDQFKRTEPIRGRLLGALLLLGDHMDITFTRTVPEFLKGVESLDVVGNFRRRIADVRLDRQHKMIKEVLDKTYISKKHLIGKKNMLQGDLQSYLLKQLSNDECEEEYDDSVLYITASDVIKNEKDIAKIRDELNIMGIPVKKWLIECDEQLFSVYKEKDEDGNNVISSVYALEPIINLDYCLEVLKGICTLSGGIFAQRFFQYSELVNFIREEERKTNKVRCAVRRLSLLLKAGDVHDYVIYYDKNNWSFYCQKNGVPINGCDQKDIVYEEVKKIIKERLDRHHARK